MPRIPDYNNNAQEIPTVLTQVATPTLAQSRPDIDRFAFLFTASLFLLTAIVGFAPRSAGILAGVLPNPPLAVHIHAFLMSAWLLLLVAQSALIAGRNKYLHIRMGLATVALVPALCLGMLAATLQTFSLMQHAGMGGMAANLLLLQVRGLLLFPLFFLWAYRTARSDKGTHKRMMLLATFVVIDSAVGRMDWLPGNDLMQGVATTFMYHFVLLVPALVWDLLRLGHLHRAWQAGLALYLPFVLTTCLLWNNAAWQSLAQTLLGY